MMTRRSALQTLLAGAAVLPLARLAAGPAPAAPVAPGSTPGFGLGVATVSLKSLPLEQMIAAVKRVGYDSISLHRAHSPWENQPGQWRDTAAKLQAAGIAVRCCGVLNLKVDEPAMRRMMEYVKILNLSLFSCTVEAARLPLLEKLIREYDLRAAIHNHGPEDKIWSSGQSVLTALQGRDERIGICYDVGHAFRTGEDPAAFIRAHHARIYDVHFKDSLAEVGHEDVPVEMGRGKMDLRAVLAALIESRYSANVWLEYEKDPNDPVPGLAESAGYVRGLLRGMK
jgi:sugar phosphate isomerase/epimerase